MAKASKSPKGKALAKKANSDKKAAPAAQPAAVKPVVAKSAVAKPVVAKSIGVRPAGVKSVPMRATAIPVAELPRKAAKPGSEKKMFGETAGAKKTEPKMAEAKKTGAKKIEAKKADLNLAEVRIGRKALAKVNKKKIESEINPPVVSIEVTRAVSTMINIEAKEAPKKKTRGKSTDLELLDLEKPGQLAQKWTSLFKKSQDLVAKPYNMKQTYEAKTPIMHKVLGWGYILTNKNDRLEVLFKDGIRFLISNYRS